MVDALFVPAFQDFVCILEVRVLCLGNRAAARFQNNVGSKMQVVVPVIDQFHFCFGRSSAADAKSMQDRIILLAVL